MDQKINECIKISNITKNQSNITLTIPNRDTCIGEDTVCTKETLQKAYTAKVGKHIDYCGVPKKVRSVQISDEYIYVELE